MSENNKLNKNEVLSDDELEMVSGGEVVESGGKYNVVYGGEVVATYDNKADAEKHDQSLRCKCFM